MSFQIDFFINSYYAKKVTKLFNPRIKNLVIDSNPIQIQVKFIQIRKILRIDKYEGLCSVLAKTKGIQSDFCSCYLGVDEIMQILEI